MTELRWTRIVAVAAMATILTACSAQPEEDAMPTPQTSTTSVSDPNPNEPVAELVAEADLLVFGTVESVDEPVEDAARKPFPAQTAVVRVDRAVKGEAPSTITVAKPDGTGYFLTESETGPHSPYTSRHAGLFVLAAGADSTYELFGNVGVHDDWGQWQRFDRVLAGLSEHAPTSTRAEQESWAAQADIIVFARVQGTEEGISLRTPRGDFSTTATLTPIDVLKGDMPAPLDVVQGPQPDVPGGTWAFPVTDTRQTGVYFIDTSSGTPTVLNTSNPGALNRRNVPTG